MSKASSTSFWFTIELPALQSNKAVTNIWDMEDNTTDPDKHKTGLKNDAATCSCTESGCTATNSPCCAKEGCTGKRDATRTLETVSKRAMAETRVFMIEGKVNRARSIVRET